MQAGKKRFAPSRVIFYLLPAVSLGQCQRSGFSDQSTLGEIGGSTNGYAGEEGNRRTISSETCQMGQSGALSCIKEDYGAHGIVFHLMVKRLLVIGLLGM